jgi:hypothetical protein
MLIDLIALYLLIGFFVAFRASYYGQNPAQVPWWAYLITWLTWPYMVYFVWYLKKESEKCDLNGP